MRHPRPLSGGKLQLLQAAAAPLRDELDCAVVPIPHPTCQLESVRAADQEEAKTDSLNVAPDDSMQALHQSDQMPSPPGGEGRGVRLNHATTILAASRSELKLEPHANLQHCRDR